MSLGLTAMLLATFSAAIAAVPALASTSVTSAGSVLPGSTSAGTAAFTLTENSVNGFPIAGGTLTVAISDSAGAPTVHFSGAPILSAPGSLRATVALGSSGTSFIVTTGGADNLNIEPITVSGLRISADAGAAVGPVKAALSGSLVSGVLSPTATASGTVQTFVGSGTTAGVVVNVSSACGFAATGGLNANATFSDVADPRAITTATTLTGGQQMLTIDAGASTHNVGTTITQTVADCLGTNLASPGTVGSASQTQHLAFTTQPGGGAAGVVWAQQPVVAVETSNNAIVTGDNSTVVTLSIGTNPAGGTLSCSSGLSRTVVNGVASFFGCSISVGSTSAYSLTATSSASYAPAYSSPFYISGSSQTLKFMTQPGGGAAGAIWSQQPVVAVVSSLNQVVTTDNTTVVYLSIGTNPAGGTLSCTGNTYEPVVNGYAYFTGCSINIGSASPYTLAATSSPTWTPATSSPFYVSGAMATVTLAGSSAGGASATSGFSTSTKIIKVGQSITIRVQSSPLLAAGTKLGVWVAVKGSNGAWGVYKPHASVTTDSTGTAYYTYKIGSKAWLAFRLYFGGNATYAPTWSYPSQFGRAM
jgi:hypothetical protein